METARNRYLEPFVRKDLERKMVFLSGPRQVGKTVVARALLAGADERYSTGTSTPTASASCAANGRRVQV
jgi:predicted AAA+ superfamily ATPase